MVRLFVLLIMIVILDNIPPTKSFDIRKPIVNQKNYFIANWKMACAFSDACHLANNYKEQAHTFDFEQTEIIICPSFDALSACAHIINHTDIKIGAQTVSAYQLGAHTGQVNAESLAQIGCKYALIGHSERRREYHETNEFIARQLEQLIAHNIRPIICIGETEQEYKADASKKILEHQLKLLLPILQEYPNTHPLIAYEPVFAIGTGIIPETDYLKDMFAWLKKYLLSSLTSQPFTLIYGGSVSDDTINHLKGIGEIQGFLIGGASLDFKKFQKIVSLWYTKE